MRAFRRRFRGLLGGGRGLLVAGASAVAVAASCVAPQERAPKERIGDAQSAVINGAPDATGAYVAVGHLTSYATVNGRKIPVGWVNTCSASLVARRVMLTAGHCVTDITTGCVSLDENPRVVVFPRPDGTFADPSEDTSRAVPVKAVYTNPASVVTVAQCPNLTSPASVLNNPFTLPLCLFRQLGDGLENKIPDRSTEATVLYLAADPPSDVLGDVVDPQAPHTLLPVLVDKNQLDPESAATLAGISQKEIESWAQSCSYCEPHGKPPGPPVQNPIVTFVGYGNGSSASVEVPGVPVIDPLSPQNRLIERDLGLTHWVSVTGPFAGGDWTPDPQTCRLSIPNVDPPAVEVAPIDLFNFLSPFYTPNANGCPDPWSPVTPEVSSDFAVVAKESHVGNGDSGGPVIVGVGPGLHGEFPSALPPPQIGDTYSVLGHYIAGIAGAHSDYVCVDKQTPRTDYSPTYIPETSKFLHDALHDTDGDTVPDIFDICAGGDDLSDHDGDGIPDDCDPCPCDVPNCDSCNVPNENRCSLGQLGPGCLCNRLIKGQVCVNVAMYDNDQDGDGYCKDTCGAPWDQPPDNCPYAANARRDDANRVSEDAHSSQGAKTFGDACDPAISPATQIPVSIVPAPPNAPAFCVGNEQASLFVNPLASHQYDGNYDPFGPLAKPTDTGARFCQRNPAMKISCTEPEIDIQDLDFDQKPYGAPSADLESLATHWHRITFLLNGNNTLLVDPLPFAFTYNNDAEKTNLNLLGSPIVWNYKFDYDRMIKAQLITDMDLQSPCPSGALNCPAGPHHLAGNLWLHVMVPWGGSTGNDCNGGSNGGSCNLLNGLYGFNPIDRGINQPQLNNFHTTLHGETPFQPLTYSCAFCSKLNLPANLGTVPAPNFPHVVYRPAQYPSPGSFAPSPVAGNLSTVLVPLDGNNAGALGTACTSGVEQVTNQVGAGLLASLQGGANLVSAVEPSRAMGAGLSFPLAVGLSQTGTQITTVVSSSGATISGSGDEPMCSAPPPNAAPAPAFERAFGSQGSGPGQLAFPTGVAVDAAGTTYVVDTGNQRVCAFDAAGAFRFCWGSDGSGPGQFGSHGNFLGPTGIAIDRAIGRVYVADTVNSRVEAFDAGGNYLFQFGSPGIGPGHFSGEMGVGVDPNTHDVYVTDTGQNVVAVFDFAGAFRFQWGEFGSGPGQFTQPSDVAIDGSGNVYVADTDNNRIEKFDREGHFIAQFGSQGSAPGQLDLPQGIALDSVGVVYVADSGNQRIGVFSPTGQLISMFGSPGSGSGQFDGPARIAVDTHGQMMVTDRFNDRIEVFGPPAGSSCPHCPSGQCATGQSGVCCRLACAAGSNCPSGYCSPAGTCDLPPLTGSPHAVGFKAVLSSYRRGIFVVGGDNPETNEPTEQIWYAPLGRRRWTLLTIKDYAPVQVLAATYSFASRRLYVLDDKDNTARLTEIDPVALTANSLGSWPRHKEWSDHWLAVDRDGAVLVASSNGQAHKHIISRLDVRISPPALAPGEKRKGSLLIEPVADRQGYLLVLRDNSGNDIDKDDEKQDQDKKDKDKNADENPNPDSHHVRVVRLPTLPLEEAEKNLADLGDQL